MKLNYLKINIEFFCIVVFLILEGLLCYQYGQYLKTIGQETVKSYQIISQLEKVIIKFKKIQQENYRFIIAHLSKEDGQEFLVKDIWLHESSLKGNMDELKRLVLNSTQQKNIEELKRLLTQGIDNFTKYQEQVRKNKNLIKDSFFHENDILSNQIDEKASSMIQFQRNEIKNQNQQDEKTANMFIALISLCAIFIIIMLSKIFSFSLQYSKIKTSVLSEKKDERYKIIFDQSVDAQLLFDKYGLIDCNNLALEMIHCKDKKKLRSKQFFELSPHLQPDGQLSSKKYLEMQKLAHVNGKHCFEWVHETMDGATLFLEITLKSLRINKKEMLLVVWHDISKEQDYRNMLEKLHTINLNKTLSLEDKIYHVLKFGLKYLQMLKAEIFQIKDDNCQLLYSIDSNGSMQKNKSCLLINTFGYHILKNKAMIAISHVAQSNLRDQICYQNSKIESYIGYPLYIENVFFGAIGYSSIEPRKPFSEREKTFIQLIAQWIQNEIERDLIYQRTKESEIRLRQAISVTKDGIWDWNYLTGEVYYSPQLKAILGYNDNEIENTEAAFHLLVHPEDYQRVRNAIVKHFKNHFPYEIEFRLRHKNGSYVWIRSKGQAIWNEQGKATRFSGFVTEMNENPTSLK